MSLNFLKKSARELSDYPVQLVFTKYDGTSIVPVTIEWVLSLQDGTPITTKQSVDEADVASTTILIIGGSNIEILPTETSEILRLLTVKITYNDGDVTRTHYDDCLFPVEEIQAKGIFE
jgi:hypothetical protein